MYNTFLQIKAEYRKTLVLALPIIGTQLAYIGMEVVDTIMIGRLGKLELASVALSGISYFSILVFFIGLLSSVGVLIARDVGAKQYDSITLHLYQAVILCLSCSLPSFIAIWCLPNIFLWINQDPQIVIYCAQYLHAVVWGVPGFLLYTSLREFTTAMFMPKVVMWITIIAIPANALLNYIFIYGSFGVPAMGIAGAGYATSLINWSMLIVLVIYILQSEQLRKYLFDLINSKINFNIIKAMLRIGGPVGILFTVEVGLFAVVGILMGYYGATALAAHQVTLQLTSVAFMVLVSFSQAAGVRISHAIGANQKHKIRVLGYSALHLGLFTAILTASIMTGAPKLIASIFFDTSAEQNKDILLLSVSFLQIAAIFQFSDALQVIMNGALRGMKDTFVPMIIGLVSYWVIGISSGLIASQYWGLNSKGLWVGLTIGLTASGLLLWSRFIYATSDNRLQ
jgi:MATE family multidrug resistance protein